VRKRAKIVCANNKKKTPHCLYRKKAENKELAINGKKDSHLFGGLHIYP